MFSRKFISSRRENLLIYTVLISVVLSVSLTITALMGKEITLKYGDFRVEINHSHKSHICELPSNLAIK